MKIWAHVKLQTMDGEWSNVSRAIDISKVDCSKEVRILLNTSNYPLWDGVEYMENPEDYTDGIVTAPIIQVELYNADPTEYLATTETSTFQFQPDGVLAEQVVGRVKRLDAINDFRRTHLLDVQTLGLGIQTDQEYIQTYNRKLVQYQRDTSYLQDVGAITQPLMFIVGFIITITSILTLDKGGFASLVFGLDMMQSSISGHSVFSLAVGWIKGIQWSNAYVEKDRLTTWGEFNVYAPMSHSNRVGARLIEAVWSMVFTIAISKGLGALGKLLGKVAKWIAPGLYAKVTQWRALETAKQMVNQIRTDLIAKGQIPDKFLILSELKKSPELWQALNSYAGKVVAEVHPTLFMGVGKFSAVLDTLEYFAKLDFVAKAMGAGSKIGNFVSKLMVLKKLFFGGITGADWIPGGAGKFAWSLKGVAKWFLVNWGDNFLYTFVVGENTISAIFAIALSISRGEWVGFFGGAAGPTVGWAQY